MSRGYYRGKVPPIQTVAAHGPLVALATPQPPPEWVNDTLAFADPALNKEVFKQQGYTGSQCSNCNSLRMKVSGHCEVCEECGTTTGCS